MGTTINLFDDSGWQDAKEHENHGPFESKHGAIVLVIWDPYDSEK